MRACSARDVSAKDKLPQGELQEARPFSAMKIWC
ncbi:uncharacterized protein J3R85_009785 [Psidium guajava]|nr:uncharacterized protein J3R85_009785 [Psidium guajava]